MQSELIVLANRLPVGRRIMADGTVKWQPSSGGLVTALAPVMREHGGAWIGWNGGEADVPRTVKGLKIDMHGVSLSEEDTAGFYHGFANSCLWPLFHDLVGQPIFDQRWWQTYRETNRTFADRASAVAADTTDPVFWVHDYHLMLAPKMLRETHPDRPIGFFLHIPFPAPELFSRLPWARDILDGLLGAGAIGFHTDSYRQNFLRCVAEFLPDVSIGSNMLTLPDGRRVIVADHPISIDAQHFSGLAADPDVIAERDRLREQFKGRRVFLGVDRLDYTKGVRHRMQALSHLLSTKPDLRKDVVFVQIAVPSRDDIAEYRTLRDDVERIVGRLNGTYAEPGYDVPVHYYYRGVPRPQLAAWYLLADVMCVTPLKDGMNLVAKEFAVTQHAGGGTGALLLSRFTGAWEELGPKGAVGCNPWDVEGLASSMHHCLDLRDADKQARLEAMAKDIHGHDVHAWVADELDAIVHPRV